MVAVVQFLRFGRWLSTVERCVRDAEVASSNLARPIFTCLKGNNPPGFLKERKLKVIIIFASFVGNTETMAEYLKATLQSSGHQVESKDVVFATPNELLNHEVILLGSPTYEPRMIHDDMLDFYDDLQKLDLSGKKAAAFGPGDTAWPDYCTAVEMLEDRLKECKAEIISPCLMVDGVVEEAQASIQTWAKSLI